MLIRTPVSSSYQKLFNPGYIGKLRLKNRIMLAAMKTLCADMHGCVTARLVGHYQEMARGGAGLLIVEGAYIDDKASKSTKCQIGATHDEHMPGLRWLAHTIKVNGASACLQINHAGRQKGIAPSLAKAPSRIPYEELGLTVPEELRFEEIGEIVEAFGDAAVRAKQAGFDMVEVLGGHGYLITNFLSAQYNRRNDSYGGSLKDRMRFLVQIIKNIRTKVGSEYPLCVRLSGTDYAEEEPITIEETMEVAQELEKLGVDALHISGGDGRMNHKQVAPMYLPAANNVWAAAAIKKVVSIPIIASGSISTPDLAEKILQEEKAHFVALGRPLFADPYYPLKAQEGRAEDIVPCIRCMDGCSARGYLSGGLCCSVNPMLGNGGDSELISATKVKKVAIIGGGPAGLEAARIAAERGHKVTLFEKRKLGGVLLEAAYPDFKSDIRRLITYLCKQIEKTGIEVVKAEATYQIIRDGGFDTAIVATGATPKLPDVPGNDKPCVVSCLDVLRGAVTGKRVVVIGGGMIGSDVGLFLAEQGKAITITTRGESIARDMDAVSRLGFLERLSQQHVEILTGIHLAEIVDRKAVVYNKRGRRIELVADNIVLAGGFSSNTGLFDELCQLPDLEVYAIGDCVEPRKIFDAVHEGFEAACRI